MTINIKKATNEGLDDLFINITRPIISPTGKNWKKKSREQFESQAEKLYAVMKIYLPQGTRDQLFALMAQDKASLYQVSGMI